MAFSFDSLVHVELDVLAGYLSELAAKLSDDGVAVLHHSNAHRYARSPPYRRILATTVDRLPPGPKSWINRTVGRTGLLNCGHLRATTVSARRVVDICEVAGLTCVAEELLAWQADRLLTDCLSVITRPESRWDQPYRLVEPRASCRRPRPSVALLPRRPRLPRAWTRAVRRRHCDPPQ